MGISFIGLILMVVVIAVVVGGIVAAFRRGGGGSGSSMGASTPQASAGVMLDCPHCGAQTEASRQVCSHCHMEL